MSSEIDKRIVEMEFRNEQFEKNAEKTRQTLKKLEDSLDFESGVSKSLDVISSKFTTMGTIGQTVLRNLTNSAVEFGKKAVKALTIDGITEGFGQYESILTSTKVLMNATGDSMESVTKYLDDMQKYAEETVYDFAFMTENITKFVNTGLGLDKSVEAMKGLGNAMAYAGVEGQKANSVIYNFSQALSVGYMGLIDWKSLELAGMATKQFKQILLDTAVEMGTVVKVGEKYKSVTTDLNGKVSALMDTENMRNELASRWLTNDVLIAAMAKYSDETTELGKAASKAARDITKFSKMMDALKEGRSGGWATSMKLIFGDLEEATEMWTGIFNRLDSWMTAISNRRNNILKAWAGFGGRNEAIQAFHNMLDIIENINSAMTKALNILFSYNKGWRYLKESTDTIDIGPVGNVIYESMVKASRAINNFTNNLKPTEATLTSIKWAVTGVSTIVRDIISVLGPVIAFIGKIIKIASPLLKIVLAIAGAIGTMIWQISDVLHELLDLGPAAKNLNEFLDNIYKNVNAFADRTVEKIQKIPYYFANFLAKHDYFRSIDFSLFANGLYEGLTNAITNFKEKKTLGSFFEGFFNTEAVKQMGEAIRKAFSNILANTKTFVGTLRESLMKLGPVGEFIVSVFDFVLSMANNLLNTLKTMTSGLSGMLGKTGNRILAFFSGIEFTDVFDVAKVGVFIVSMINLRNSIKTIADIGKGAIEVLEATKTGIKKFAKAVSDVGKGVKMSLQAEAFKNIAYGLGVIVSSIIALSTIEQDKLSNAVNAFAKIVLIVGALVVVIDSLKVEGAKASKGSKTALQVIQNIGKQLASGLNTTMVISSISLLINSLTGLISAFTIAIAVLGNMDYATMLRGLDALKTAFSRVMQLMGVIGAFLVVITKIFGRTKVRANTAVLILKMASSVSALAFGISALAIPLKKLGSLNPKVFSRGFGSISAILGLLSALFIGSDLYAKLSKDFYANITKMAKAMVSLSLALIAVSIPVAILGSMNPENIGNGLKALGMMILYISGAFLALSVAAKVMGKTSAPIIKMALAFSLLTNAIAIMALAAPLISNNAKRIKKAIVTLVNVSVDAIVESSDKIVNGLLELISITLIQLAKYLPQILDELEIIIDTIVDWLVDYLPTIGDKVGQIIGIILDSVMGSLSDYFGESGFKTLIASLLTIILFIELLAKTLRRFSKNVSAGNIVKAITAISLVGISMAGMFKVMELVGLDPDMASKFSIGMSMSLAAIAIVAKEISRINSSTGDADFKKIMGVMLEVVGIASILAIILGAFTKMNLDPVKMIGYSAALSVAFIGITPMLKALSEVQKYANRAAGMKQLAGVLVEVGGIAATLAVVLGLLTATNLNPIKMALYSGALSVAFIGITPMLKALSTVQQSIDKNSKASLKPMIGILIAVGGIAGALAVAIGLLTKTGLDPVKMIGVTAALSVAFIGISPMLLALGVVQKMVAGINDAKLAPIGGVILAIAGITASLSLALGLLTKADINADSFMQISKALSVALLAIVPLMLTTGIIIAIMGKLGIDTGSAISAGLGFSVAMGIIILITTGIAGLLGALNMLSKGGLAQSLEESVPVFEAIGAVLGGLIGALFGAIGGGTLAGFAISAKPFFDAIESLPDDFGDKMTALATGFLALTGAGLLNSFSDFFSIFGDNSLTGLGKDLADFAPYMGRFVKDFPDITASQAESIKNVSEGIKSLMDAIPKGGGVVQWFTGETKLSSFTENIGELGKGMKVFADETVGLDAESVENAVNCGRMIAALADTLPKTGGVMQWWNGEVDMKKFNDNLPKLGEAIVEFNNTVTSKGNSKINTASVETAVNAGKMMAGLVETLPGTGGVKQWWNGEINMETFSENLPKLGTAIASFNAAVSTEEGASAINEEAVVKSIWVAQEINALWQSLPESKWFKNFPDLGTFATNIPKLGSGIAGFSSEVNNINGTAIATAIASLDDIAGIQRFLIGEGGSWLDNLNDNKRIKNFIDNIPKFGSGIKDFSVNMNGYDSSRLTLATNALNAISDMVKLAEDLGGFTYDTFQKALEGFDVDSFSTAAEALASEANLKNMGDKFKTIGRGYVQSIYIGMRGDDSESQAMQREVLMIMTDDLLAHAKDKFYSVGKNIGLGLAQGMWDQNVVKVLKSQAWSLVDGVFIQMQLAADSHSPSERAKKLGANIDEGLGIGVKENAWRAAASAEVMTDEVFNTMNDGLSKVYQLLASGAEFEPTISPVVDLTNVRKSATELNALFSATDSNFNFGEGYGIKLTRNIKMEAETSVKPTDLTKVTDGINKLGQKLTDMEQAISDMQIYLDTGALVGSMTTPMMRSMNSQQRKMGRGVIPSRVI